MGITIKEKSFNIIKFDILCFNHSLRVKSRLFDRFYDERILERSFITYVDKVFFRR